MHETRSDVHCSSGDSSVIRQCRACLRPIRSDQGGLQLTRLAKPTASEDSRSCASRVTADASTSNQSVGGGGGILTPVKASDQLDCYHVECLNCCLCGVNLATSNCLFQRCWKYHEWRIACSKCRFKLTHCARCRNRVGCNAWIHRLDDLIFHLGCFICDQCGHQLRPGDKCGLHNGHLLCMTHLMKARSQSMAYPPGDFLCHFRESSTRFGMNSLLFPMIKMDHRDSTSTKVSEDEWFGRKFDKNLHSITVSENVPNTRIDQVRPFHWKTTSVPPSGRESDLLPSVDQSDNDAWLSHDDSAVLVDDQNGDVLEVSNSTGNDTGLSVDSSTSSGGSVNSKSKRIRTSFTPDQLAILQANFDVEANPDGQELERIANSARLNKRVTQVWFQNARARKKKIECRHLTDWGSSAYGAPAFYSTDFIPQDIELNESADELLLDSNKSDQDCNRAGENDRPLFGGHGPISLRPSGGDPLYCPMSTTDISSSPSCDDPMTKHVVSQQAAFGSVKNTTWVGSVELGNGFVKDSPRRQLGSVEPGAFIQDRINIELQAIEVEQSDYTCHYRAVGSYSLTHGF